MTSRDPTEALQTGVHARLTGDATLNGLVDGVHDEVPEDATYPYIAHGDYVVTPQGAHDRFGHRVSVPLDIWSVYDGKRQAAQVSSRLFELFDHRPTDLTVAGFVVVAMRHLRTVHMRDPDPDLRHTVVEFFVDLEQNPTPES